jgi:hypothetical protein
MFPRPIIPKLSGHAKSPLAYKAAGISFAPGLGRDVVLKTECSRMTRSMEAHPFGVSRRVTYLSAGFPASPTESARKAKRLNDPWACQMEGQVADLKRRIPILKRLITDCDRLAANLDQEVRNEEDRVNVHDPAHFSYSIYARATASRRDNLSRSVPICCDAQRPFKAGGRV